MGQHLSDRYTLEEGVPQGCVVSVTLFTVKVNQLGNIIPNDPKFLSSLYVDDFQLSFRDISLVTVGRKLQTVLYSIHEWCNNAVVTPRRCYSRSVKNGFTFSLQKTKPIHFTQIPRLHLKPELHLQNEVIEYKNGFKFLGLIWDDELTWALHVSELKNKCKKMIGMIKFISSRDWGG